MSKKQQFIVRSKMIRGNAVVACQHIAEKPVMVVTIEEYHENKTQAQLGYLWGVILPTIRQHIEDANGDRYTVQNIYDWFITEFADQDVVTINGRPRVTTISASRMDTKQMSDFMTKIIQMAADDLDCVIPWPEVGMNENQE